MKTNLFKSAILATLILCAAKSGAQAQSAFSNAVINLNPVAYWPLQETAQPSAADVEANLGSLGPAADAYYAGTNVIHSVAGATGDGNSADDFQNLPGSFLAVPLATNGIALASGPFTVEAWIYPTNIAAVSTILAQTGPAGSGGLNGGVNSAGWSLNQNYIPSVNSPAGGCWSFHVYNGAGFTGGAEAVAYGLAPNQWFHLVGVFDGTNAYLYVDATNSGLSSPINGSYVQDTWDPLTIGCGRGLNNNLFGGSIDEVAVYTNALTASRILAHYQAAKGSGYSTTVLSDNPAMYWRMDAPFNPAAASYPLAGSYGSSAADGGFYLSGTTPGLAGPPYAGLAPGVSCGFNGLGTDSTNSLAVYTNQVLYSANVADSGVLITNVDPLLNTSSNDLTVAIWFKANPADTDARFQTMIGHGNNSWRLNFDNGSGVGGKVTFNPGMGSDLVSSGTFNDGAWHFAVGVYYNSGVASANNAGWLATNYLYVDGILNGTALVTNKAAATSTTNILIGGAPDYVANGLNNTYNQRFFAGSLAQAAYFNTALTPAQIQALYDSAGAPPAIQTQPAAAATANGGTTNVFTAVAGGDTNLMYQWYYSSSSNYNGTAVASGAGIVNGPTNTTLTITNLTAADSGFYYLIVTNNYGSATSILSQLTVVATPVITGQNPTGPFGMFAGQYFNLSVTATGPGLVYQWLTNGVADTSAGTSSAYSLAAVATAATGSTYQCIVTNSYGSATSLLATLTVQLLPAFITNSIYSSNILALKPAAYWPMHEIETPPHGDIETNYGSLGPLADGYYADWSYPGSNVTHQITGALAGDSDSAASFYGTGSTGTGYMLVPRTLATGLTPPFTVEAWVRPVGSTSGDVISQYGYGVDSDNAGNNYGFRLMWGTNDFQVGYGNGTSSGYTAIIGNSHTAGQWYHVAVTYDGTNAILYVNGQQDTSGQLPFSFDPALPLTVGSGFWSSTGPTHGFEGGVDEVAIYTNLLTQQQIANDYAAGTSPTGNYFQTILGNGPALYYRMDAPTYTPPPVTVLPGLTNYGTVALNGVYNANCAPGGLSPGPNIAGTPIAFLSGTHATAGNGLSAFADAGYSAALNPTGRVPISVSCWFKANPTDNRFQILFGNDSTWRCAMDGTVGRVHFNAGAGGEITSSGVYNDGNWHQLVGVYNGTVGSNNFLYVDGVLDSTSSTATNAVAANPLDILMLTDPEYTNSPIGPGRQFGGSVCEVAFWTNTILSASQVQALYNSAGVRPFVTAQPVSGRGVNGGAGSYIYFGVTADGSTSLGYQWYFNTTSNYNGATALADNTVHYQGSQTTQVTVTNLTGNDTGYYYVVITNSFGSATSQLASLTVYMAPSVAGQLPMTYTNLFILFAGASPTFSVSINGAAPLYYQWFTNGISTGPATTTGTNLALSDVQNNFTNYCVITNSSGSVTSALWSALVIPAPTAPYPQAVLADNPVGYWRMDDVNEDGGENYGGDNGYICHDYIGGNDGIYTNVSLNNANYDPATDPTESSAEFGETGNSFYDSFAGQIEGVDFASATTTNFTVECWANGYLGSETTGYAILSKGVYSLNDSMVFDFNSSSAHYFRFYVRSANGTVYQCASTKSADGNWHHLVGVCNESAGLVSFYIDGALAASTSIPTTAGLYEPDYPMSIGAVQNSSETVQYTLQFYGFVNDVAVFNYALTAGQISAQFAASGTLPIITQQPVAATNVDFGGTLAVPVGVIGTMPLSYQWYNAANNNAIGGQTNSTLVVKDMTSGTNYYLTIANSFGTTNTSLVSVGVISGAPQIYAGINPTNWATYTGGSVTFSVTAYGSAPIYYQWYENGTAISLATNSSYTAIATLGTNIYDCAVSNAYNGGSIANSGAASLIGVSKPSDPYSQQVLNNGPIAYWRLDETNGNIANDYVGEHDALYTNVELGVPDYNQAFPDTAADFGVLAASGSFAGEINNSSNGLPTIDFSSEANAEFSVEAWVNAGSSQPADTCIMSKGYSGNEQFDLDTYGGDFRFFVRDEANVVHTCTASTGPDGNWHHLVGVCDEINGLMHLYVDGVDSADASIEAGKSVIAATGAADPQANLVNIGARASSQSNTSFNYQLDGIISDAAIYGFALSSNQVSADYLAGLASGINTNPTNIVSSVSGKVLTLSWPADHIGWQLQAQTNNLLKGIGANWVNVSGSSTTNQVAIPINLTNGAVFYRLIYQP